MDEKGRRKEIIEGELARYRDVANDNELIDRKFGKSYEHLLASIKCTTAKCDEPGCVLKIFTKDHAFKEETTKKNRVAAKGTKCSKSATLGTCLPQWFGLGILDDISRQAKSRETRIAPDMSEQTEEDRMKAEQKYRNDRSVALITESVSKELHQAEALAQQAEAQRPILIATIKKIKENAGRLKDSLDDAVRRQKA